MLREIATLKKVLAEYSHGCIMIDVPHELSEYILKDLSQKVPEKILKKDQDETLLGFEPSSHITVLFGVDKQPPIEGFKPFKVKSADHLDYFDNDDATVIIIPIESPELHQLHEHLKETIPNEETYPTFKPHCTLCYTKPGSRIDIDKITSFEWTCEKLLWAYDGKITDL